MRRRSVLTACFFGAALGAFLSSSEGHAQVNWTHTQISTANGSMPSIAVDRLGYVHVGWTLNMGGSSWFAYQVDNQSGEYVQTLVDSKSTSTQAIFPFLSTDSLGFYHLVWRDLAKSETVFYRTNNPLTRALVKKGFSGAHAHEPILDLTSDDIAHVITEADSCSGCSGGSNLYDEGLTATAERAGPVISLPRDTNDSTGVQQFSSTVTADDARHLVFSMRLAAPADNQRLIYYSTRAPGSMTWSAPVSITGHEDNYQGWPAIVADPAGKLHVVYSSGDYGIYYVSNAGGAWSAPLRINDQNQVADAIPSLAIDPNGRLHVAFQRFTPSADGTVISLHYTTNAYDPENWLDPAPEVLTGLDSQGFRLTHQNRKIAINWVDNQVLIPYQADSAIWLALTSDVPVTPADPGGTSTLVMSEGFVPPVQLVRSVSNTAAAATRLMQLDITDAGGDDAETRISELHVNIGAGQTRPRPATKDEGLAYLLGGAELVTDSGQTLTGIVSDTKVVFRDSGGALWVSDGATRSFSLRVWARDQPYVTGNVIELRIKPDQDVITESGGSAMLTDQPVVYGDAALIVDTLSDCPEGSACSDGNACTFDDTCNASNLCAGTVVTCESDACNARTCNGSASCSVAPIVGGTCGAVNECELGTHDCSPNASCVDTLDSFDCVCQTGYEGDGVFCGDVNECEMAQSVCEINATCTNSAGAYSCACNSGYVDEGSGSCEPEVPLPVGPRPSPPDDSTDPGTTAPPPPASTPSTTNPPAKEAPSSAEPPSTSSSASEDSSDAPSAAGCSVARAPTVTRVGAASVLPLLVLGSLSSIVRRRRRIQGR